MVPTLHEGDLLLALWGAPVRPGRVCVVTLPPDGRGRPRPVSVKRVTGRDPDAADRWWVDADNPREGVTSFDVGSLPEADVHAVVVARVAPRPRWLLGRHTNASDAGGAL